MMLIATHTTKALRAIETLITDAQELLDTDSYSTLCKVRNTICDVHIRLRDRRDYVDTLKRETQAGE